MTPRPSFGAPPARATALLAGGLIAGPLFNGLVLAQGSLRPGFSLERTPLSLLSLGPYGWIQTANFVVTGVLIVSAALGVWKSLRPGPARALATVLLVLYGLGILAAGLFPPDAIEGFPPGSHQAAAMSRSAQLHGVAFMVAHIGAILAMVVFAVRDVRRGDRAMGAYDILSAVATPSLIVVGFTHPAIIGLAFFLTGVVALGWLWVTARRL